MDERQQRIRERAHRLWEQEGRPDGRAERHWLQAEEIVATEEGSKDNHGQADDGAEAAPPASPPRPRKASAKVGGEKPAGNSSADTTPAEASPPRPVRKRPRPARSTRSE